MASVLFLIVPLGLVLIAVLAVAFINHDRHRSELQRVRRTHPDFGGVLTANAFSRDMGRELSRATRHGFPVAVSLLSVESARAASTRGEGDDADDLMREAAKQWVRALRDDSPLGRRDAATFVALLPHADRAGGQAAVARLRHTAPRTAHPVIGAVVEFDGQETAAALLTRAESELRRARRLNGVSTPAAA